ncbi:MAG TPA: FAD-dependent oxidoreductase [Muricauda sp.]|uniref:NADH:ubiquinone reductase (non-electrogenic) n=1 Tax=Flagellimonas aurea TaxID=2915619 RepID=A0ABS3G3I2_9FLAO|nr:MULTISPECIES: NAD(P)/FAD-dependent oxidoreductase [Allomuricauda]MAU14239.1 FAD-dependent oxidoreductase [Allomuricauda sp.]MBC73433.1 FAD-dependent oxidoreductase [Allomuricauda sp.]MBO0353863.1 NAD(P)/FAD-dependent oxidoreductase [Allomuricauda aurea]HBU76960.1 FAD-dependent oxidoreductase [Allomuricauda sp.]|tara:strand:+ start:4062 stop:5342 length:1281 start_codon:yes stop_codon:yes gene_type:complete
MKNRQRVIIVGGGFAGLELVKGLANSKKYEVILVDVNNYNFFPPLIYQVSTGFMEPSAISYPFRRILRKKENVRFRLGSLERVVPEENKIILSNGELIYDILVMATGAESNFFGNKNIERYSLPMKTISDALSLRNTILARLDRATRLPNLEDRRRLLSFVIAGAGPTGVELSGIMAEMSSFILKKDYPELSQDDIGGIYLIDGQDAVLTAMSTKSQEYTYKKLKKYGVEIKLNTFVKDFDNEKVMLSDGTEIRTKNLIWAAGVSAKTFEGFQVESFGKGKRLKTNTHNLVVGYDNIYALGDCALVLGDKTYPNGHPQLAQPALQQAKNLSENLKRTNGKWKAFRYIDKGSLAIIGRNKAVLDLPGQNYFVKGFLAWLIWIFVHIMSLVNFKNRVRAFFDWIVYYIYKDQYFRMIIKPKERDSTNR